MRHAPLLLLLVLAMLTGAAQAADDLPRPWIDPVVSAGFDPIVARCRFIYTQPLRPLRRVMQLQGDDAPATYALAGMEHDLVKTSHPVRPYLGRVMLRYALVLKEPPADAQAQAEEARYGTRILETLEFAWQARRWVFRGVTAALFTGPGGGPGLPVVDKTPAEAQAEHAAALKACTWGL